MIQTFKGFDILTFDPPLPTGWTHSLQRLEIHFSYTVQALIAAIKNGAIGSSKPTASKQAITISELPAWAEKVIDFVTSHLAQRQQHIARRRRQQSGGVDARD